MLSTLSPLSHEKPFHSDTDLPNFNTAVTTAVIYRLCLLKKGSEIADDNEHPLLKEMANLFNSALDLEVPPQKDIKKCEEAIENTSDVDLLKGVSNLLYNTLELLENKTMTELELLQKRQSDVEALHELLQEIQSHTNSKGEVDLKNNPRALELLKKAKELGVKIDDKKLFYNKESRENLIDAIDWTIKDLNVQFEMQMQTVTRLTNLRYEFIQLARLIEKRIDECLTKIANGIKG